MPITDASGPTTPEEMPAEMPKIAFCAGCNRYVQLTPTGDCREGHPRSSLRDVREGTLDAAPTAAVPSTPRTAEQAAMASYDSPLVKLAGIAIVMVPIALVLGWGIWTGMEEFSGAGMSVWTKLGWSVASLALTFGLSVAWYRMKKRR